MLKEVEETILKGKATTMTGFQKAAFTVKCQNPLYVPSKMNH